MRFKVLSMLLLLVSFTALGVLTGAIPVLRPETAQALEASGVESAAPQSGLIPARDAAPIAAPTVAPTAVPMPAPTVAPTAAPTPVPTQSAPVPTQSAPAPVANPWQPDVTVISTTITSDSPIKNETVYDVDGEALAAMAPAIRLPAEGYQILILHTHATEAYTPDGPDQYEATAEWRTTDTSQSVVRVGQALAEALEGYGLRVLHDTTLYDWPSYNGSYARSGAAIEAYLQENPGLSLIIDLHRDALGDDEKTYRTLSEEQAQAAQIMFVMGSEGTLSYPAWRENLGLAMSLQGLVQAQYPTLMRPTLLCPYRYNQQLSSGSLLMEVGTAGNTLQQAVDAVELFAQTVGPALAERVG